MNLRLPALLLLAACAAGAAEWEMEKIRPEGTPHEVRIWRLEGAEPGPTLLVIGGIHGDEPGGYLSADLLLDRLALRRGSLILVPRSNLLSIVQGKRGAETDLNREFGRGGRHPVIGVLEGLMGEADALLNLHDGYGFYREEYVDRKRNPRRYGQAIVGDAARFTTPEGREIDLEGMALRVIEKVNRHIADPEHHFRYLNTRTADPDSRYRELAASATFHALMAHGIPGYGVETSKNLPSDALRIRYQVLVIKAFLEEFGLEEDPAPLPELPEPELEFVLVRVEDQPLRALKAGDQLQVAAGERIEVAGVEANVERGIVVDVQGRGGLDDLGGTFTVDAPLQIAVHRDERFLGSVTIRPGSASPINQGGIETERPIPTQDRPLIPGETPAYSLAVNGEVVRAGEDQVVEVTVGDRIRLLDPRGGHFRDRITLDLVGFPGGNASSSQEDRGFDIDTATDLLSRYSLMGRGEYYRVRAREDGLERGGFYLRVRQPAGLVAVTVETGAGGWKRLPKDGRLSVPIGEILTIRDVETTIPGNAGVVVNFKGFSGGRSGEDRGLPIRTDRDLLRKWALDAEGRLYEIQVLHDDRLLGRVLVELEDPDRIREAGG